MVEAVERAQAEGLDITADQYPYLAGSTMLGALLPPWCHAEGTEGLKAFLRDPALRERIESEIVEGRADWEINSFFIVWALALLHALVRPARSAWVEQLWAASALLFLLPVLNALTTQRPLWHSLAEGDWVFAGMDIMCWALALLHAVLAIRTARQADAFQSRRATKRQAPITVASSEAAR